MSNSTETEFDEANDCLEAVNVLASDFIARYRNGDRPTIEEYAQRHAELSKHIRDIFPLALSLEKIKVGKQSKSDGSATLAGRLLKKMGDFTVIREIGRGGMGIVFEAQQESLGRRVAIKVLPKQCLLDDEALERFNREAINAAAMHHSNIVPIFGTGEYDGTHYLVMQLVQGLSLDRILSNDNKPLDVREVARIGVQVADALAYAHAKGVLHRDIKPANILIEENGAAQITDFGLARNTRDDVSVTRSLAGSLRYMAPERFQGISNESCDVYSLGVTLFEMLSGEPAFKECEPQQMIETIRNPKRKSLRQYCSQIPIDFETIVYKAMHFDPAARYATASELRDELNRFLSDEPIHARRSSSFQIAVRWCRRNPRVAIATGIAAGALLLATVASTAGYALTSMANRRTSVALEQSEQSFNLALQSLDGVVASVLGPTMTKLGDIGSEGGQQSEMFLKPSAHTVKVLESILPLYESLSDQSPTRRDVIVQMMEASVRLSQIQHQLGHTTSAIATLRRSISLLSQLNDQPRLPVLEGKRILARLNNEVGLLIRSELQFESADKAFCEAVRIAEELPTSDFNSQFELARALAYLGDQPPENRQGAEPSMETQVESTEYLTKALDIISKIRVNDPTIAVAGAKQNLTELTATQTEMLRARIWLAISRLPDNRSIKRRKFEFAIGILRDQLRQSPDNTAVRFSLVEALADVKPDRNPNDIRQNQQGTERLQQALEELSPLRMRFPESPVFAVAEVHIWRNLSSITKATGQLDEAKKQIENAVEIQSLLLKSWPNSMPYRCWRALLLRSLAEISIEQKDLDEARATVDHAIEDVNSIDSENANHPFAIRTRESILALKLNP